MSTLRTTTLKHGSSTIDNIVFDNQGRSTFGADALFVNAQNQRVGVNTTSPAVALDVVGAINATGNVVFNGQLNLTGNLTVDTNTLVVDSTNNRVGIGTASPARKLTVSADTQYDGISINNVTSVVATLVGLKTDNDDGVLTLYENGTKGVQISAGTDYNYFKNGNVGIGTNLPFSKLHVASDGQTVITISNETALTEGVKRSYIKKEANNDLGIFATGSEGTNANTIFYRGNSAESMRIDSSGRLLVGTGVGVTSSSGVNSTFQVHSTNGPAMFGRFANDATAPALYLIKSRNTTVGSQTIVNNGDNIGRIAFEASDGSQLRRAATVDAFVDGTPGSADMPGRLAFSTTADGASSPTERMRIRSDGNVALRDSGTNYQLFSVNGNQGNGDGSSVEVISVRSTHNEPVTNGYSFQSRPSFNFTGTTANYFHYGAVPNTVFSGTLTNQFGFFVGNTLNSATNNYGFYSNIPTGTNRWNFYADGTASNYFAGATMVGGTNNNPVWNNDVGIAIRSEGHFLSNVDTSAGYSSLRRNNNGTLLTFHNNSTTACGIISVTGQTTAYATSSDYRLKENVVDLTGAIDRVNQLQVRRFNFIADPDKTVDGFIAHEAQEIVPESVTGTKDAMEDIGTLTEWDGTIIEADITEPDSLTWDETITDEDTGETIKTRTRTRTWVKTGDRPVMQGIDQSKLVPLLTAALQEAIGRIKVLEQRVLE